MYEGKYCEHFSLTVDAAADKFLSLLTWSVPGGRLARTPVKETVAALWWCREIYPAFSLSPIIEPFRAWKPTILMP